ncbi:hypothetical protein GTO89_09230 [Heliobacterium gestii]|uniref:Uncharacterized protein n=1 Tax=Heliomicrobium gestii TaxID=2699 RepID=A0A845LF27_HELGE|nr:hypothetical protein [Heliomicrobium gestii]MBM7866500.1 hypothetical protein [Heliomicrobium gestii]MZP43219.1 hypothetical protein [Heliomicrobium gestii]
MKNRRPDRPHLLLSMRYAAQEEAERLFAAFLAVRDAFPRLPFGVEVNINHNPLVNLQAVLDGAEGLIAMATSAGVPYSLHLPSLHNLDDRQTIGLNAWLKGKKPLYCVIHGGDYAFDGQPPLDSGDFLRIIDDCRRKRALLTHASNLYLETLPWVRLEKKKGVVTGRTFPITCVGIFQRDLSALAEDLNCHVLVDVEHLYQSLRGLRLFPSQTSERLRPADRDEQACLERYGAFVRDGRMVLAPTADHRIREQLARLATDRYHFTGSYRILAGGRNAAHREIQNNRYARTLLRHILAQGPASITTEACMDELPRYSPEVQIRSLRALAAIVDAWLFPAPPSPARDAPL